MATVNDLELEYRSYLDEKSQYDKELYAYERQLEEQGVQLVALLQELNGMGITFSPLKDLIDEEENLNLNDKDGLKRLLQEVANQFNSLINESMTELKERKKG